MAGKIIKEVSDSTVVIRSEVYSRKLSVFTRFYEVALQDFPDLKMEDCTVQHYENGYGLEFPRPEFVPDTYDRIAFLRQTK